MVPSSFFSKYPQKDIFIQGFSGKSPLFFRDLSFTGAGFLADLAAVEVVLPAWLTPVKVFKKKAIVVLAALEYRDTDIGPYNEVSVAVLVHQRQPLMPKGVNLAFSLLSKNLYLHILQLPVTTEVALAGGIEYFNFPKYLSDISFRETATHRICTLREKETSDLIFEVESSKGISQKKSQKISFLSYSSQEGKILKGKMLLHLREFSRSVLREQTVIHYGRHEYASQLKRLGLGRQVFQIASQKGEAVLFMPEKVGEV